MCTVSVYCAEHFMSKYSSLHRDRKALNFMNKFILNDFDIEISEILLVHQYTGTPHFEFKQYINGRKYYGLTYATSGKVLYHSNDQNFYVTSGDVVFLPAGSAYWLSNAINENYHHITVNFNIKSSITTEKIIENIINTTELTVLHPQNKLSFDQSFNKLITFWTEKNPGYMLLCRCILYQILYDFLTENILFNVNPKNISLIHPAKEYIDNFYMKQIKNEELASMCDLSVTHFRRLFTELYGFSPIEYLTKVRIDRAKDMLLYNLYSIDEIATHIGIDDINYFNRLFKKKVGTTPIQFKKQMLSL